MIDTHCHLLPALDDGPSTEIEAIRMARRLVEFGVNTVVCTPHFSRRYPTSVAAAMRRHEELRRALTSLNIELRTHLAAEIGPELALRTPPEELASRSLPGGYVIVELVSTSSTQFVIALTKRLADLGLRAVLAHPERCHAVQKHPAILDDARAAGALVQIVGPSLLARRELAITTTAWSLIDSGRADLLASDAHRAQSSRVQVRLIGDLVQQRYGAPALALLTLTNPRRLLEPTDQ